jgi:hypothetical protein
MRTVVMAAALAGLLTVPAQAQMMGGGGRGKNTSDLRGPEQKKPVVDEKAYKSALERIPEPTEKYDPWGVARPQSNKPG